MSTSSSVSMLVVVDLTQGTTRLKKLNDDKVHVILFYNMESITEVRARVGD